MKGLPKDIILEPLLGRNVQGVEIGKFYLHLLLDNSNREKLLIKIETESDDILFFDSKGKHAVSDFRTQGGLICLLLGLTIENASRRDDGGLILSFSTDIRLEIGIHAPNYESIVLHIGEEVLVG